MNRPRAGWRIAATAVAVAAALMAIAGALSPALAGNSSSCSADTAVFSLDQEGSSVKASVGYEDTGATNDRIGRRYKGRNAAGDPIGGTSSCGASAGITFESVEVSLGDKADELRLDARKPNHIGDAEKLPSFVDATIHGGKGPDVIRGHKGYDEVDGAQGDDLIRVDGGGADFVNCGTGDDKVYVNASDVVANCERVVER